MKHHLRPFALPLPRIPTTLTALVLMTLGWLLPNPARADCAFPSACICQDAEGYVIGTPDLTAGQLPTIVVTRVLHLPTTRTLVAGEVVAVSSLPPEGASEVLAYLEWDSDEQPSAFHSLELDAAGNVLCLPGDPAVPVDEAWSAAEAADCQERMMAVGFNDPEKCRDTFGCTSVSEEGSSGWLGGLLLLALACGRRRSGR